MVIYTVSVQKMNICWRETTPPYRAPLHRRGIIPPPVEGQGWFLKMHKSCPDAVYPQMDAD